MARYHIYKLGFAILFFATHMGVALRSDDVNTTDYRERRDSGDDNIYFYQGAEGTPGVDFPTLSYVPKTKFTCRGTPVGYYADLDTDCQVFHICDEGRKLSFLCPNGTIFQQSELICDWWYKVNCTSSPSLYEESAEMLQRDNAKRKEKYNAKSSEEKLEVRETPSRFVTPSYPLKNTFKGFDNSIATTEATRLGGGRSSVKVSTAGSQGVIEGRRSEGRFSQTLDGSSSTSRSSSGRSSADRSSARSFGNQPSRGNSEERHSFRNSERDNSGKNENGRGQGRQKSFRQEAQLNSFASTEKPFRQNQQFSNSLSTRQDFNGFTTTGKPYRQNQAQFNNFESSDKSFRQEESRQDQNYNSFSSTEKSFRQGSRQHQPQFNSFSTTEKPPRQEQPQFDNVAATRHEQSHSSSFGRQDQASNGFGRQDQSSSNFERQDQSSNNFGRQDQSSNHFGRQDQSSKNVGKSSNNFRREDKSSGNFGRQDQPSNNFGRQEQPANNFGREDQSSNNFGRQNHPSNNVGRQDQSSNNFGRQDQSSSNFGRQDKLSNNFGREDKSSNNFGRQDQPSNNFGRQEQPSNNVGRQDQSSSNFEKQRQSNFEQTNSFSSTEKSSRPDEAQFNSFSRSTASPHAKVSEDDKVKFSITLAPNELSIREQDEKFSSFHQFSKTSFGAFGMRKEQESQREHEAQNEHTSQKEQESQEAPGSRFNSGETQEPQESSSFVKSPFNTLMRTTENPYPNHRTTYSEIKDPRRYYQQQSKLPEKPFYGSSVNPLSAVPVSPSDGLQKATTESIRRDLNFGSKSDVTKRPDVTTTPRPATTFRPTTYRHPQTDVTTFRATPTANRVTFGITRNPGSIGTTKGLSYSTTKRLPSGFTTAKPETTPTRFTFSTFSTTRPSTGGTTPITTTRRPFVDFTTTRPRPTTLKSRKFNYQTTPNALRLDEDDQSFRINSFGQSGVRVKSTIDSNLDDSLNSVSSTLSPDTKTSEKVLSNRVKVQADSHVIKVNIISPSPDVRPTARARIAEEPKIHVITLPNKHSHDSPVIPIRISGKIPEGSKVSVGIGSDEEKSVIYQFTAGSSKSGTTRGSARSPNSFRVITGVNINPSVHFTHYEYGDRTESRKALVPSVRVDVPRSHEFSTTNRVNFGTSRATTPAPIEYTQVFTSPAPTTRKEALTTRKELTPLVLSVGEESFNSLTTPSTKEVLYTSPSTIFQPKPFATEVPETTLSTRYPPFTISTASPFTTTTEDFSTVSSTIPTVSSTFPTVSSTFPTTFTTEETTYPIELTDENITNMINTLMEIVRRRLGSNYTYAGVTPRPGLVVPPSVGPQTLHSLAVYFANALSNSTSQEVDEESTSSPYIEFDDEELIKSLLTQMTRIRYEDLFKGKYTTTPSSTTPSDSENDLTREDTKGPVQSLGIRQLARVFTEALSAYLEDPVTFRKVLYAVRPTEPAPYNETETEEDEVLNYSDSDLKGDHPHLPTRPTGVSPTWGFILALNKTDEGQNSIGESENLHLADSQSFVSQFNRVAKDYKTTTTFEPTESTTETSTVESSDKALPENHWTTSSDVTKLWQTTLLVNPVALNEHFGPDDDNFNYPDSSEVTSTENSSEGTTEDELRTLPKIELNSTQVHGILIDFMNSTQNEGSVKLQRLLDKLNITQDEFLSKMKEIEGNPLTRRLILLLISECTHGASPDLETKATSNDSVFNYFQNRLEVVNNTTRVGRVDDSDTTESNTFRRIVHPALANDDEDTRALELLNSLYVIASKFGK